MVTRTALPVTIVIPTYRRETTLLNTLVALLSLDAPASEILVVDQTEQHEAVTDNALHEMVDRGQIRWLRLCEPSIPRAMNIGLVRAAYPLVLFLDDDIRPAEGLVAAHYRTHQAHPGTLVAGKVIQPWNEGRDYSGDIEFHFATTQPRWITEFMGGNFSVTASMAKELGGFDENFVRVAYKFEAEFAHRLLKGGRRIYFEPSACLHHLKVSAGGTRSYGEHLTAWRPDHAVGAYYFGLRTHRLQEFVTRPFKAIATQYHLRHPWRIPGTLMAELTAVFWAVGLYLSGPKRLLEPDRIDRE